MLFYSLLFEERCYSLAFLSNQVGALSLPLSGIAGELQLTAIYWYLLSAWLMGDFFPVSQQFRGRSCSVQRYRQEQGADDNASHSCRRLGGTHSMLDPWEILVEGGVISIIADKKY